MDFPFHKVTHKCKGWRFPLVIVTLLTLNCGFTWEEIKYWLQGVPEKRIINFIISVAGQQVEINTGMVCLHEELKMETQKHQYFKDSKIC